MPAFETSDRVQKAVLWIPTGDNVYGQKVVGTNGVEINVRWVGKTAERLNPQGNTITLDATIITDRVIPIGSIIWQGSLDDIPGTATPRIPTSRFYEVKTMNSTGDIKNRFTRYEAGLMRYSDSFPST